MKFYWIFLWSFLLIVGTGQEPHTGGEVPSPTPSDHVAAPTEHQAPTTEHMPPPSDHVTPPPTQQTPPVVEHPPPPTQHTPPPPPPTQHTPPPPTEHTPPPPPPTEQTPPPPPTEHTPPPPPAQHTPPPTQQTTPPPPTTQHTPPPPTEHTPPPPPPTEHTPPPSPTEQTPPPPPTEHAPPEPDPTKLPVVDAPPEIDEARSKMMQIAQQVHQIQSVKSQSTNIDYGHVKAYSFYLRSEPQQFLIHLKHAQTIKGVIQVYKQQQGTYLAGQYQPGQQVQIQVIENQHNSILIEVLYQTSGFQFHGKPDTDYLIKFQKNGVDKLILLHMQNFVESSKIDQHVIGQDHITHHDRRATYIRDKLTTFMSMTETHATINEDISQKVVERLQRYLAYHWFEMFAVAFISIFQIFLIRRLVLKNTFVV